MEKDGWQIAFLSTSHHSHLPAVIDSLLNLTYFVAGVSVINFIKTLYDHVSSYDINALAILLVEKTVI